MDYPSFEAYLADQNELARSYLKELRACILEAVPEATELMNYNIPAFALVSGGKREEQVMIAGYKKHVGFYPHPDIMEIFWDRLEIYKKAKGSVQFPLNNALPKALIIEMVRLRRHQILNREK